MSTNSIGYADADPGLTVDALAAATATTVRTVQYYAGLGLIPPPIRRGRVAFYTEVHAARLRLVRALQDHGLSLTAIEDYLARIPAERDADELAVQRLALSTWSPHPPERTSRSGLERRAGRPLGEEALEVLSAIGVIRSDGDELELLPGLDAALAVLDLGISLETITAAGRAIQRHTAALAEELTEIFGTRVIGPYRAREQHTPEETAAFQDTIVQLRELTLEAVRTGFQRAANEQINRSLRG